MSPTSATGRRVAVYRDGDTMTIGKFVVFSGAWWWDEFETSLDEGTSILGLKKRP